ncbi:hypothetical protein FZEAL_9268 [Fusarium zealandicum]|uniref:Uncharacterized protein n=1 Tax=Fusarium zealandicum TaxID=1053134 RepID=A0A8H4UCE5_9HYPO|nr:hypothetical protein FZEAL_9268 [Fusarium zealandicum]
MPELPLRERRKAAILPGEQQPWAPTEGMELTFLPAALGPCPSYPINMPFKSNELFHYFYELEDSVDIMPREKRQDMLTSVTQSPDALRNTILVAGLHYAWNVGHLQRFEPTLLFHKIESMRLVNGCIKQSRPKSYSVCIRQIATLCFTECCLGNVATAETHLIGLVKFMDLHSPPDLDQEHTLSVDEELSNRYVILVYNFIYAFKSRLQDIMDDDDGLESGQRPTPAKVEAIMHAWHKEETRGLEIRLKAMKMFPFFFAPLPPTAKFCDIDALPMLDCMITLTETTRFRGQRSEDVRAKQLVWFEGAATRLLLAFVGGHIESLSRQDNGGLHRPRLKTSWCGMSTATGLYLHAVLGLWNAGQPIEPQLHRRVLTILKHDLNRSRSEAHSGSRLVSDLWFWKAFNGAFSLAKSGEDNSSQSVLEPMQRPFRQLIRGWSDRTGIKDWPKARKALENIVWPGGFKQESVAETIWNRSIL